MTVLKNGNKAFYVKRAKGNRFLGTAGFVVFVAIGLSIWHYIATFPVEISNLEVKRSRVGVASWYSRHDPAINPHTANGEVFDDTRMTCATWDFPFNEKLVVINALTGARVICRVNDRGPAKRLNRRIDLTQAAFAKIANRRRGLINVIIIPVND